MNGPCFERISSTKRPDALVHPYALQCDIVGEWQLKSLGWCAKNICSHNEQQHKAETMMSAADRIMVLNGPTLNLLGLREPDIYGSTTLAEVEKLCQIVGTNLGMTVEFHQSNHEGVIIDLIHEARARCAGIVINPAGFTSTSIAILDALLAAELPIVEVHISNIHRREVWRHHSYVSTAANAVIMGSGSQGYDLALQHMAQLIAVGS